MLPINLLLALGELAIVIVFALVAIKARALDRGGFLASVAVGYAIFLGGGWQWFVVIASFFIIGVAFTWYKYEYKKKLGGAQEKGGARNWPNILANGGAAAVFGLAELLFGGAAFAVLYLGAMSAAAADTVATELGLLNRTPPRLITHPGTKVAPGTSGGVTRLGFAGSILASLAIGSVAAALGMLGRFSPAFVVLVAVVGGLSGSTADSLIGATLQRKGVCVVCGSATENLVHCGRPTERRSGFFFMDNNIVNLLATVVGAGVSLALAAVLL
ncbi:MAG: DUF92 domain-containing protein [Nitrososphaerota archaeon]|nr:DUF92 domain-containing protein [Nitrososphaerota archaeon]